MSTNKSEIIKVDETTTDYAKLYKEKCKENETLTNKCTELESLCKSFAQREKQTQDNLQRATTEYNARINYMLDSVKHCYMSIQFAINANENNKGASKNDKF